MIIDDITLRDYIVRFNEISEMLARLDTGSNRRKAGALLKRTLAGLKKLKRDDASDIGETEILIRARLQLLDMPEKLVDLRVKFRSVADDLSRATIPDEAWRPLQIIASQYASPQEKIDAEHRLYKIGFRLKGGRPSDHRRDIAILIAVDLYERTCGARPRANRAFVDFCQEIYSELGLTDPKDVDGLEDRVRRTLRDLNDPDAPA
jgi:hypothetical protein